MRFVSGAFAVLACAFLLNSAQADVGLRYGYGSRSAALGGAAVAWGADGYAASLNPAALSSPETLSESTDPTKRLVLSWGIMDLSPHFTAITNIVTENTIVSDKTTREDVNQDYKATFGQALGIYYRLFPETLNLTLGMTAFLPLEQLGYLDSGEPYVPEYVLYRADSQRPNFDFGLGAQLSKQLHVGVGLHLGYAITGSTSVFIQTDSTHPSSMRLSASQKVKASPYFGALYFPTDEPRDWSVGAVVRLPLTSDTNLTAKAAAQVLGNFAAFDFNFNAIGAHWYDPLALQLGTSFRHWDVWRTYLQLDYQFWSNYKPPTLTIVDPTVTNCQGSNCTGIQITPGANTAPKFKNILVPRIGEEFELNSTTTLRLGYSRRPSMIEGLPTGTGNLLDPGVHLFNAGAGFHFKRFLSYEIANTLDIHVSYDRMDSDRVTKTAGDEAGNASGIKIGSPGYDVGGNQYGGGASLTLAF